MSKQTKFPMGIDSKKISGELFTLTYGALVAELLRDLESPLAVNRQLDKMGYNIGLRLADDLLAKNSQIQRCTDMHQVADVLAKVALRSYLGENVLERVTAQVLNWNARNDEFSLILESNPLAEFVEIPPELAQDLSENCCGFVDLQVGREPNIFCGIYSQILCGAIRGALEMMHMEVQTFIVQEHSQNVEIRVKFIRILQESIPPGDD
ncbi:Trafficking protein particle complex subunit 3 [Dirofilaria immitis]|nr:Trafficking protein particle complex subunit 3 [Dirofilaria immitis]